MAGVRGPADGGGGLVDRVGGRLRGGKPEGDGLPGASGGRGAGAVVVMRCGGGATAGRAGGASTSAGAASECAGASEPHQTDAPEIASCGHPAHEDQAMLLAEGIILYAARI